MISERQKNIVEMSVEMRDLNTCEEKQFYRWSGMASLLLAIGYVAIIPLFAWAGGHGLGDFFQPR